MPPGGFIYFQKETEFTIKGENEDNLIDLVIAHRKYRNLHPQEPSLVRLDIERQICTRLGIGECRPENVADKWVPQIQTRPVFTMGKVIGLSNAALEFVKSGMNLVPIEEAQRRAEICKGCAQNRELTGCSCSTFHKLIAAMVPASRKINGLFVCWACGCDLRSKVNLEDSVIIESNKNQQVDYPAFCWQRAILAKEQESLRENGG